MTREEVYVNYDEVDHGLIVRCDCGNEFEFQTQPTGFCPRCGGKIIGYKADKVPMNRVPLGYQAYLFNKYDSLEKYYYHNADHWNEVFEYWKAVYNNKQEVTEYRFNGWCYANDYEPVFFRNGVKTYMGYENKDGDFIQLTDTMFKKKLYDAHRRYAMRENGGGD